LDLPAVFGSRHDANFIAESECESVDRGWIRTNDPALEWEAPEIPLDPRAIITTLRPPRRVLPTRNRNHWNAFCMDQRAFNTICI